MANSEDYTLPVSTGSEETAQAAEHTCHGGMNPTFPYPCAACAREQSELDGPASGARGDKDARARDAGAPQSTGASCPHVWQPIATAPVGYDGKKWTHVLFRGTSKGRSFPGSVVVQGWMGKTHDGRLEPVHSYSYKLNIDAWMPVPADAPPASSPTPKGDR